MKLRRAERILLAIGLTLVVVWVVARLHRAIGSQLAIARFEVGDTTNRIDNGATRPGPIPNSPVDFRLWSAKRISAYKDSLALGDDAALAILRIPKIDLEAPVFDGTDDLTLNRGVGRIRGTARIGEQGNLGIAGHRDGFFRGLESIALGDVLELVRPGEKDSYIVTKIQVVTPKDTSVLSPTVVPTVTLVTCFPFYFVGNAPKRYIVTAQLEGARPSDSAAGGRIISGAVDTDNDKER